MKKYSEHAGRMVEIFRCNTNYTLIHDQTISRLNIENVRSRTIQSIPSSQLP